MHRIGWQGGLDQRRNLTAQCRNLSPHPPSLHRKGEPDRKPESDSTDLEATGRVKNSCRIENPANSGPITR